jgi:hypothetical protein
MIIRFLHQCYPSLFLLLRKLTDETWSPASVLPGVLLSDVLCVSLFSFVAFVPEEVRLGARPQASSRQGRDALAIPGLDQECRGCFGYGDVSFVSLYFLFVPPRAVLLGALSYVVVVIQPDSWAGHRKASSTEMAK